MDRYGQAPLWAELRSASESVRGGGETKTRHSKSYCASPAPLLLLRIHWNWETTSGPEPGFAPCGRPQRSSRMHLRQKTSYIHSLCCRTAPKGFYAPGRGYTNACPATILAPCAQRLSGSRSAPRRASPCAWSSAPLPSPAGGASAPQDRKGGRSCTSRRSRNPLCTRRHMACIRHSCAGQSRCWAAPPNPAPAWLAAAQCARVLQSLGMHQAGPAWSPKTPRSWQGHRLSACVARTVPPRRCKPPGRTRAPGASESRSQPWQAWGCYRDRRSPGKGLGGAQPAHQGRSARCAGGRRAAGTGTRAWRPQ
mmetsp:Transcript_12511/g.32142  ORF Transcript_12511/g.32142 Transcript_12511/m.32142 type:complete len:309 (-) Transcript_12511:48-974(-)